MCHYGQHIWILYQTGSMAVFDMESHEIMTNIKLLELSNDPVTTLVVDHDNGLIATAYSNGLIAYLWDGNIPFDENVSYYQSFNLISSYNLKLTTMESCNDVDGCCQIWCGYNNGAIQIVTPPVRASETTESLKVLKLDECCADLPPDSHVSQLKFSGTRSSIMYALHNGGLVVSCWSVGTNPKLCCMIKTSVTSPGKP